MSSLSARLLLSVSLLLLFFFGVTIVVLDSAFREAGEQAREDILDGQLMMLLAAAEPNIYGELEIPEDLREGRFNSLDSGLYGELRDETDVPVWRSRSSLGMNIQYGTPPNLGTHQLSRVQLRDGTPLMALTLSVEWELPNGSVKPYTFSVAESMDSFNRQVKRFRRQLFGWFAAVALIMLFSISMVMRVLLRPLRQIEEEISDIEAGRRAALSADYPTELTGVARNMNLLVGSERARSERYRNTLDNLAHSLKTPLAAIRSLLGEQRESGGKTGIEEQIDRMNDIVRYQLRKPATYASETFGMQSVPVARELGRLVDGLNKVYSEKSPRVELQIPDGADFVGEPGDLLELAGNLLDNAYKWCKTRVRVTVELIDGVAGSMRLIVADDGHGIPAEIAPKLLQRGMRLDESAPGHGIGLAVVNDIAASYGGELTIGSSEWGGAEITVTVRPGTRK